MEKHGERFSRSFRVITLEKTSCYCDNKLKKIYKPGQDCRRDREKLIVLQFVASDNLLFYCSVGACLHTGSSRLNYSSFAVTFLLI